MTNIYDFESHKKALAAGKKLDNERGEQGDIDSEIEWASKELDIVHDSLDALRDEILVAESYRLELIAYTAGMEMAKKLIEGRELKDEDFWDWFEDKDTESVLKEEPQLEILFMPDSDEE